MAPIQPPPWHKIYNKCTPVAWLTDVSTAHALSALADARSAAESSQVEGGMNVDDEVDANGNSDNDGSSDHNGSHQLLMIRCVECH